MPKEVGIMFSGNHPRLILEERKTMTRRTWGLKEINKTPDAWFGIPQQVEGALWRFFNKDGTTLIVKCPFGQVGDRLWVKEKHYLYSTEQTPYGVIYYADAGKSEQDNAVWRPSIFIPRWASRILLEITELRGERLWQITEKDAIAEGIDTGSIAPPVMCYCVLWDSLNSKRGYPWANNNWVWPIGFKLVKQ